MDNQLKLLPQINKRLSPDWLNFVVTSKARSSIRLALRNQKISQARKAGKLMLENELKKRWRDIGSLSRW